MSKPESVQQAGVEGEKQATSAARRLVLIYAVFATLWILVSDHLVAWVVSDPVLVTRVSVAKGWFFVAVTTALLYGLIRRMQMHLNHLSKREQQAQRERANTLQLLDDVVQSSSDAIFAKDLQGRYLVFNAETARIIGKTAEEAIGRDDSHIFPEHAALIRANDQRVIQERQTITYEETLHTVDGMRTFLAKKGPLRSADGEVIGLFGISRDITERKSAEAVLHQREGHFRQFFEKNSSTMLLIEPETGRIKEANEQAVAFYGYPRPVLLNMSIQDINTMSPDLVAKERERALREERNYFQFTHRLANGELREVEVYSSPIANEEHVQLWSIIHDVTERKRSEEMLRKLFTAVEQSPTAIMITNLEPVIEYVNPCFTAVTGYSQSEALGKNPHFLQSGLTSQELYAELWSTLANGDSWNGVLSNRRKSGETYWVESHVAPVKNDAGQITHYLAIQTDITERRQTELLLAESEIRLRTLVQTIPDLIWLKNTAGVYLLCNSRFEEFFGAKESEIVGKTDFDFVDHALAESFRINDQAAIAKGGPNGNEEWVSFASDGHRELLETTKSPLRNAQNEVVGVLGIGHDITERNAATTKIAHLAFYDSLTDLPNRRLMLDRLGQALVSASRRGRNGALMLIDLDNFKLLNDTLGHATGDELLQQVAVRLRSGMREGDTVARMGGDEFVVLLEELDASDLAAIQAEHVASKILLSLAEPYTLNLSEGARTDSNRIHQCTSSIGIALFRDQSVSAQELMKRADTAMYQAKAAGRNTLRFFDAQMQNVVAQRAAMEVDMRSALLDRQFVLHYQPQVDESGHVTGAEVLVRWQHPQRGLVAPVEFIGLAEETGLILSLGQWVLETACAQLGLWSTRKPMAHLTLAVNVSARQIAQPLFVSQVLNAVDHFGVPQGRLKLEITESLLLENTESIIGKMTALKARGIGFSLDDFGTGYSSLSYLKRLPLDQLKIDQSFVRDILTDANDAAIARTVIALGNSLGLAVIAEGVESQEQRDYLYHNACHAYQGYWFSRPLVLTEFETFVQGRSTP
jgi:diguanylate cyclase (GGDEF)-like protein/PAS domain S-box-containing protein